MKDKPPNPTKQQCRDMATIVLDGNRPEDRSGAKGNTSHKIPSLRAALGQVHDSVDKAAKERRARLDKKKGKPKPKTPLQVLMTRLKRFEERIAAIQDLCAEHIDRYGGEPPSTVARIQQIANGEYDR